MNNLKDKRVMVTGGESMIGSAIVRALEKRGAEIDPVPHVDCNLLIQTEAYDRIMKFDPHCIIHAAGWNGGIEWNRTHPETIYYRTATMALNVFSAAVMMKKISGTLEKTVGILASCSYPNIIDDALNETEIWNGKPNDTVECHGLSKRIILDYSRQIHKQHHIQCISCILTNSYGPGDSFHPEKTKVVGALIKKFVDAAQNDEKEVMCWGTGSPLREFMFCDDAGEAITQALEKYDNPFMPINIGSGQEVSIKELTEIIAAATGYTGEIKWDSSKPDGQKRKLLDTNLMKVAIDLELTPLQQGIEQTVNWYLKNKEVADAKGF